VDILTFGSIHYDAKHQSYPWFVSAACAQWVSKHGPTCLGGVGSDRQVIPLTLLTRTCETHTAAEGSPWEQGSHLGNACYMSLQRGCWTDYIHCLLLIWRGPVSIPSDTSRLQWICMKIMKDAGCEDLFTMTTEPEPVRGRDKCNRRTDAATHNLKVNITSH
jgi:hypothetical protein